MRSGSASARAAGVTIVGVLVVAALFPASRPAILAALSVALLVSIRLPWLRWPAAAGLPVSLNLTWGTLGLGLARPGLVDCADPLSPPAVWRLLEAVVVVGSVLLLARWTGTRTAALGLRPPGRAVAAVALASLVLLPAISLVVGLELARPYFGELRLSTGDPAAILPAAVLAGANGTMEELIYRGSLMTWLTPLIGGRAALIGQALVFGLAHTGSDFVGSPIPVLLVVATSGLVAGLIVRRTGSLALPVAVHVALDVPLYYAAACRVS